MFRGMYSQSNLIIRMYMRLIKRSETVLEVNSWHHKISELSLVQFICHVNKSFHSVFKNLEIHTTSKFD